MIKTNADPDPITILKSFKEKVKIVKPTKRAREDENQDGESKNGGGSGGSAGDTPPPHREVVLYEHQEDGVEWMKKRERKGHGGILADEMGLGKTLTAIFAFKSMFEEAVNAKKLANPGWFFNVSENVPFHATLIVVPKSVMHQWRQEFARVGWSVRYFYGPKRDFRQEVAGFQSSSKDLGATSQPLVMLTTYGTLVKTFTDNPASDLFNFGWRRLVLDEAHEAKEIKSKRAGGIQAIFRSKTWCLTGTPIMNQMKELATLVYIVTRNPELKQYIRSSKAPPPRIVEGVRRLAEHYVLSRKKKDHLKLPEMTIEERWIPFKADEEETYKRMWDLLIKRIQNFVHGGQDETNTMVHIFSAITQLRRYCMHPLLVGKENRELLNRYLEGKEKGPDGKPAVLPPSTKMTVMFNELRRILTESVDNKVLVFSQWTGVMNIIQYYLKVLGVKILRIDGKTSQCEREKLMHEFQTDKAARVFLISLKAGGTGINLTAANHVLIADPYWNSAIERQAMDRAHRLGQTRPVKIYRYFMKHDESIEWHIYELQRNKNEHVQKVFEKNPNSFSVPALGLFYKQVQQVKKQKERKKQEEKKKKEEEKEKKLRGEGEPTLKKHKK